MNYFKNYAHEQQELITNYIITGVCWFKHVESNGAVTHWLMDQMFTKSQHAYNFGLTDLFPPSQNYIEHVCSEFQVFR